MQTEAKVPVTEGIQIMEEFLWTWASQGSMKDGEDIIMAEDDGDDVSRSQVRELRDCLEDFRPRIENNQWLQSILTSF